jgi:hypothetical protein
VDPATRRRGVVVERTTGEHILRNELGWGWQRPARRATERNDEAIQQWVKKR